MSVTSCGPPVEMWSYLRRGKAHWHPAAPMCANTDMFWMDSWIWPLGKIGLSFSSFFYPSFMRCLSISHLQMWIDQTFSLHPQVTAVRQDCALKIKGLMPAELRQELEDTITSLKSQVRSNFQSAKLLVRVRPSWTFLFFSLVILNHKNWSLYLPPINVFLSLLLQIDLNHQKLNPHVCIELHVTDSWDHRQKYGRGTLLYFETTLIHQRGSGPAHNNFAGPCLTWNWWRGAFSSPTFSIWTIGLFLCRLPAPSVFVRGSLSTAPMPSLLRIAQPRSLYSLWPQSCDPICLYDVIRDQNSLPSHWGCLGFCTLRCIIFEDEKLDG